MVRKRRNSALDTPPPKKAKGAATPKMSRKPRSTRRRSSNPQLATPSPTSSDRRDSDAASSSSSTKRNVATRSMTLKRRTQFPFLELPAELRNLIYEMSLGFDGVGRLLTDHYEAHVNDGTIIHWPELQTHALLVVNKQISREAKYILHRKTLRLPHSTTPNGMITDVVSQNLLENLRKVDITRDDSFGEMHTWCDFLEFFRLIKSAVKVWLEHHKLQELTIVMQGKQVMTHLDSCPAQGHCYFLDEIEKMMNSLKELRGIKKVTFGGFLKDYAEEAKQWMETPPPYLLKTIPLAVRKRIYRYLMDPNDADKALQKASRTAVRSWNPPKTMDAIAPAMTSPPLMRANEQIRDEIWETMYADSTLAISAPPPHHVHTCTSITKFVGLYTLQHVRHLQLDIDSRGEAFVAADWRVLIQELSSIFRERHSLETLRVNVRDHAWVEGQVRRERERRGVGGSSGSGGMAGCAASSSSAAARIDDLRDFYGLKVLGEIVTSRLSDSWLKDVSFGEGVHDDVKRMLRERLCGRAAGRYMEMAAEGHGLEGLVAED